MTRATRRHNLTLFAERRRGVALIAVLWIGLLAGLLLIGVRHGASVGLAVGHNELAAVQAHWLARAGVEQAIAILSDDARTDDSPLDLWHHDEAIFKDIELATGTFSVIAPPQDPTDPNAPPRYGVLDLSGRVNVNDADQRQLRELPNITDAIVASILDWRDRNHNTRPGGAEGNYYNRLDYPYEAANQRLQTLDELRLIKDIDDAFFDGEDRDNDGRPDPGLATWVTVYSYETNLDAFGAQRVNLNQANESTLRAEFNFSAALAEAVVAARRNDFDSVMDLLDVQPSGDSGGDSEDQDAHDAGGDEITTIDLDWIGDNLDRLTLDDEDRQPARININTAAHEVLMTLPRMTDDAAHKIIAFRDSDSGPFLDVGDLRTSGAVDDDLFRAMAERVTVRSNVFRIHSIGTSGSGVRQELVAVVDRGVTPMRILYWYQSE